MAVPAGWNPGARPELLATQSPRVLGQASSMIVVMNRTGVFSYLVFFSISAHKDLSLCFSFETLTILTHSS
jgi:hypothetical protein